MMYMMTSSNGNIFRVTGLLCGEFTDPGEFPAQRPVTRSFDVFLIYARINDWVNNREAGDLRRHYGHYDVNLMISPRMIFMKEHIEIFKSFLLNIFILLFMGDQLALVIDNGFVLNRLQIRI